MSTIAVILILQTSGLLQTPVEPTRAEAEAAMARITNVYRNTSYLHFQLEIAQEPTAHYSIDGLNTAYFLWFRVRDDDTLLYEAWAWNGNRFSPIMPEGAWLIIDTNHSIGGATSAFAVEEEQFYSGWLSNNTANLIPCFTQIINRPIVGSRSNLVRLIDKLLGTREDLLADREYMGPSCISFLLNNGYIQPDFPSNRVIHCWRRKTGVARLGNAGTYVVTLLLDDGQWIVLRRLTFKGVEVTVTDSWRLDPQTGLIVEWNRDFGQDVYGTGRLRTRMFTYEEIGKAQYVPCTGELLVFDSSGDIFITFTGPDMPMEFLMEGNRLRVKSNEMSGRMEDSPASTTIRCDSDQPGGRVNG